MLVLRVERLPNICDDVYAAMLAKLAMWTCMSLGSSACSTGDLTSISKIIGRISEQNVHLVRQVWAP